MNEAGQHKLSAPAYLHHLSSSDLFPVGLHGRSGKSIVKLLSMTKQ